MSDITTVFPPELADIGLVAIADPEFCERLLAALDCLASQERPGGGRAIEPLAAQLQGAAA
jgi:hypothetical protein